LKKIKAAAWVLFDFAETVFSANIISVFFPLWLINHLGGASYHYSMVYSLSIAVSILMGIVIGKLADEFSIKDKVFKLCVGGVIFFLYTLYFVEDLVIALAVFFIMNLLYQQSLIFYNALMTDVSSDKNKGIVSGLGVGFGYIGGVVSLIIANYMATTPSQVFLITGAIFTVFALPSLFLIKGEKTHSRKDVRLKEILKDRTFFLFLVSILFLTDAAHGVIIFMSIYLNKVFGFDQNQVVNTIAFAGLFAVVSAPVIGYIITKTRSDIFLRYVFLGWIGGFILLFLSSAETVDIVAVIFGILLAALWTTIRVVLIEFSPEGQITTRFAFMALSERMASVLSPMIWGGVVLFMGETIAGYKLAALTLGLFPLLGFFIYREFLKSRLSDV